MTCCDYVGGVIFLILSLIYVLITNWKCISTVLSHTTVTSVHVKIAKYTLNCSQLDYCNSLAGCGPHYCCSSEAPPVRTEFGTSNRLVCRAIIMTTITPILQTLHWLLLCLWSSQTAAFVWQCLDDEASTMCQPVADNAGHRHLRSAARGDLAVPATRTLRYTVLAASPWQDRPPGILFQNRYAAAILHPRSVVI